MNKLLIIDLSEKSHAIENLPQETMDQFLGGRGLGAYLLYSHLQPGVDPLSPENIIIYSAGPAQGTSSFYGSRAVLTTKSPLTGIYLFSVASGRFGHEIKKAGYAAIMIKGKSAEPTYLNIHDGEVEFKSAKPFWGLTTIAAHNAMINDTNWPKAACVCIGPAGEALSKMALVATEGEKVRTFGRGGAGAVMGSKNLKGIVASGSLKLSLADQQAFEDVKKSIRENVKNNPKWAEDRRRFGTGSDMPVMSELGILPTRNWQTGQCEKLAGITLTEIEDIWPRKNVPCGPYCINPCSHIASIDRGPWKGARTEGPEYETFYSFGTNCGIDRFDAIVAAEQLCDEYGVDTMSCGCTIAFAMECFEKGLITKEDTGGIELKFGDAAAMVKAVEMLVKGEGLSDLFGQGVRSAAEKIPGSAAFAMHAKGLELGGYECRGSWGQALQFALASRGGCHHAFGLPARTPSDRESGTQIAGKAELVKTGATNRIILDSAVLCSFPRGMIGNENLLSLINAITAKGYSQEELDKVGLRIINLERMFNVREGLRREDDNLPKRLTDEPLPDGPHKGSTVPLKELLDEGYQAFGWDKATGIPTTETLQSLDLAELCRI